MPFMPHGASWLPGRCGQLGTSYAQAVKLEGGKELCPQIKSDSWACVNSGMCTFRAYTTVSYNAFGGFKVQGKGEEAAQKAS